MNFVLGKGKWKNSGDIWIRLCWVNRSLSRQQVARGHNKQKQRKCYKNLNFLFTWSFHNIFICHLTGINLGAVVTGEDARFAGSVYKEVLTWPNIRFPWGSHIEADTLPGFFFQSVQNLVLSHHHHHYHSAPSDCHPPYLFPLLPYSPLSDLHLRYLLSLDRFHSTHWSPQSLSSRKLTHVRAMSSTVPGTWEILPQCLLSEWINTWEKSEL